MPELSRKFRLSIIPFTFVHIGNGDDLDPTQYVISNRKLWVLNQSAFIAELARTNPTALAELDKADFRGMARLFSRYFDSEKCHTWQQSHECSEDQEKDYLARLEGTSSQMLISAFTRNNLTGDPYIPGSSLKGAIRTAWLAAKVSQNKIPIERNQNKVIIDRDLESKLLEYLVVNKYGRYNADITQDPFKYLKLADAEFPAEYLTLKTIKNIKQTPTTPRRHSEEELAYQAQVIRRDGVSINGELLIDKRWEGGDPDAPEKLFTACRDYYRRKLNLDQFFFSYLERPKMYQSLIKFSSQLKTNEFILKMGKGSGSIFTSLNPQKPQTRTVIGAIPMGWCKISYEEI